MVCIFTYTTGLSHYLNLFFILLSNTLIRWNLSIEIFLPEVILYIFLFVVSMLIFYFNTYRLSLSFFRYYFYYFCYIFYWGLFLIFLGVIVLYNNEWVLIFIWMLYISDDEVLWLLFYFREFVWLRNILLCIFLFMLFLMMSFLNQNCLMLFSYDVCKYYV